MNTSRFIARLVGPLFLVMGLGMVIEGDLVRALSQEFLSNISLIYLAGMLTLVAGLAIINTHNVWEANWRVIVTILGWLAVIGGVIRLLFPGKVQALGVGMLSHRLRADPIKGDPDSCPGCFEQPGFVEMLSMHPDEGGGRDTLLP